MNYECFDLQVSDRVAHLQMTRPEKANSMVPSFWRDLPEIVAELSANGAVRALVLSGQGRHFCSGMDLEVFAAGSAPSATDPASADDSDSAGDSKPSAHRSRANEAFRSTVLHLQDSFSCLEGARMPVIAAIQGACVGGAIDMVSACDMRYTTENAYFAIAEIDIGMTADVGTLQRMPKLVADGVVRELAFTGRRWRSDEAKEHGFVNQVYPDQETMLEGVLEIAAQIAAKSPMAIWGTKRNLNFSRDHSVADSLEFVANWNAAMFDRSDMGEAFLAKLEDRPAEFPDLSPLSNGL